LNVVFRALCVKRQRPREQLLEYLAAAPDVGIKGQTRIIRAVERELAKPLDIEACGLGVAHAR